MRKKGLSPIVSIVLIIGLTIASIGIVFTVVKNMSEERLNEAQSCFEIIDTFEINGEYTCYDKANAKLRVSISRNVVSLDYLLVAISSVNDSKTFKLYDAITDIDDVTNYPVEGTGVKLPKNESGQTYVVAWDIATPENIQIAPSVNGKMCHTLDEMSQIPLCS